MEEVREKRLIHLRKTTFRDRLTIVEDMMRRVIPKFKLETPSALEVVVCIPEVDAVAGLLVQDFDPNALLDILERTLLDYMERRLQAARTYFGELVKKQINLDESVDPLSLAVGAWFVCQHCDTSHCFPAILGHHCSRRGDGEEDHVEFAILGSKGRYCIWRPKHFQTEVEILAPLVRTFDLDPRTATISDMDAVDTRLRCTRHAKPGEHKIVISALSWRSVVRQLVRCLR